MKAGTTATALYRTAPSPVSWNCGRPARPKICCTSSMPADVRWGWLGGMVVVRGAAELAVRHPQQQSRRDGQRGEHHLSRKEITGLTQVCEPALLWVVQQGAINSPHSKTAAQKAS